MRKVNFALIGLALIAGTQSVFAQDAAEELRRALIERRIEARAGRLRPPAPPLPDLHTINDAQKKKRLIEGDMRRKLLQWHDKDGDGQLNAAEKQAARAELLTLLDSMPEPEAQRPTSGERELAQRRDEARRQLLAVWDKDGNGELSEAERNAMQVDYEKKREAAQARMLKEFDKNGNGTIDVSERDAVRASYEKQREDYVKNYDRDGNGRLSEEERRALIDDLGKQRDEVTRKYDANGNGCLEFDEEEKAYADGAQISNGLGYPFPNRAPARPQNERERRPPRPTGN